MRNVLASLLLGSILFTAGCLGCGVAYKGAGDQVYASGQDQLILCENGGFSAMVGTSIVEGFYTENAPGSTIAYVGTEGDTGAHAFDMSNNPDGTSSIPQFGSAPWTKVSLDQAALDHADVACQNLETRTWWTSK